MVMTLEQLGYTCKLDEYDDLECEIKEGSVTYCVDFHIESKCYETHGIVKGHFVNHPIDMELNEAIQNKLKELGWL